jgi:hypothetical protein
MGLRCGGNDVKPCEHDSYPFYTKLIGPLREAARKLGYAIGVHGTLKRDIDLIACPWTSDAVSAKVLARAVQAVARQIVGYAEPHPFEATRSSNPKWFRDGLAGDVEGHGRIYAKPHGRRCWSFYLTPTHDGPYIDLSVFPRYSQESSDGPTV